MIIICNGKVFEIKIFSRSNALFTYFLDIFSVFIENKKFWVLHTVR